MHNYEGDGEQYEMWKLIIQRCNNLQPKKHLWVSKTTIKVYNYEGDGERDEMWTEERGKMLSNQWARMQVELNFDLILEL